ncbi:MAG TPA: helix-turn-helix domain-containing protein [Bryobacteraceae bacterium]|nr:helix-turn-helix domain-containing protein [Bryobacteraceae bacterium]
MATVPIPAAIPPSKIVEPVPAGQLALDLALPAGGMNLSERDRAVAEKRFDIIAPLLDRDKFGLLWFNCHNRTGEMIDFLTAQHGAKRRTLYDWLRRWERDGIAGLVDRDRKDKGRPRALNAAALDFILAAAMPREGSYGSLSVKEIFRAYLEERAWRAAHATKRLGEFEEKKYFRYLGESGRLSAGAQLPLATYETLRTWFNRIPEVVRVMARDGEEAFHNTQEILSFRNLTDIRPLDYVVMDHRRLDIFCLLRERGGWKLGRPWLTAAIDMRTRKWLSWVIVENPSSDSIAAVLKRTFLDHGLPAALYWDNGKDFTCEWFEGKKSHARSAPKVGELGSAWRGVLETLGVRVTHAIVKRARSKIIEPNFINVANFDKTTPWYCGHKPSARPERFAALLDQHERWLASSGEEPAFPTIGEVAATYDEALETLNEREHSGEGMSKVTPTGRGWCSPNEAWERLIGSVERRSMPPDVIQFAFAKRRKVTVRNGEIRTQFDQGKYHYRLSDGVSLMAYNGETVEFGYDPLDLETISLYRLDRFLGLAHCVELRRMGEQAFVADEKNRRASRREVKKFIRAVHQQVPIPDYEQRAARRRAAAVHRTDPERAAAPRALPDAIVEASRTDAGERAFSFAAAPSDGADVIRQADANAYSDDDGGFQFFKDEDR